MPRVSPDPRPLQHKKVFTTGEVAKLLCVSQMSVIKWFNDGRMKGYRIPYSKDRRITRENLIEFMKTNHVPDEVFMDIRTNILVVDDDPTIRSAVQVIFEDDHEYHVESAVTGYEAGVKVARTEPDVLVLDVMLSDMDARELVKRIRADEKLKHTRILGISGFFKQEDLSALKAVGFDDFLFKPFTAAQLKEKIVALTAD
ncbi:MAG: response regulator [Candidatus Brocadiia bacterium]